MPWSDMLMDSLDRRSTVLHTSRGAVQVGREGDGAPVLAIHGGPGGFDQGLAWCRHLGDGGCEVIALSRPGYLRTPLRSGESYEEQADLCAAALDALDIDRAAIVAFSSGAASAVHFAARYPDRVVALLLDAAILLPYEPPISALQRATFETGVFVRLSHHLVNAMPRPITRLIVDGSSTGLSKAQRKAAAAWITSDVGRLESLKEQAASMAPKGYRTAGWINDQANERDMAPLPFERVAVPTLIAHGANDAVVPVAHATEGAARIPGAEMVIVDEGHHLLSLSRHYAPVARRQLELAAR